MPLEKASWRECRGNNEGGGDVEDTTLIILTRPIHLVPFTSQRKAHAASNTTIAVRNSDGMKERRWFQYDVWSNEAVQFVLIEPFEHCTVECSIPE